MQISIATLSHEHTLLVREFNIRLVAHDVLYRFPLRRAELAAAARPASALQRRRRRQLRAVID